MKRRGRALARRYGRAKGFRIDFARGGLVEPERTALAPGHLYAMGASSSPDVIEVTYVTDDRIGYRKAYGKDSPQRAIERWIGEDLIAQGTRTFTQRYGVDPQRWHDMTEAERREQLRGRL